LIGKCSSVFVRAIAGDGVIAIGRVVLEQILFPNAAHNHQTESFLSLNKPSRRHADLQKLEVSGRWSRVAFAELAAETDGCHKGWCLTDL